MNFLFIVPILLLFTEIQTLPIHKQCFQKEKSLAMLELAKDSISKAKNLLPECDGGGSNKTACGKKEQAAAYIEAALGLIEEAERNYPECESDVTTPDPDETTPKPDVTTPEPDPLPRDCLDVLRGGWSKSGVYAVQPDRNGSRTLNVFCDMTTDGGGWTVIQRRDNFTVQEDFYRDWNDYKQGFGNLTKDFWLGNDNIHVISNLGESSIRLDLQSQDFESRTAVYGNFRIEDEQGLYRLHVGSYSGKAGDGLHDGRPFSTRDRQDAASPNCAVSERGGWWFNNCGNCNLNGLYSRNKKCDGYKYLYYYKWKNCEPLKAAEMKVRRIL